MLTLHIKDNHDCGPTVFDRQSITLGRTRENDVKVPNVFVSRSHARFYRHPQGYWVIEDLGSTNGTRVNGTRIAIPSRIFKGDVVRLGLENLNGETRGVDILVVDLVPMPEMAFSDAE